MQGLEDVLAACPSTDQPQSSGGTSNPLNSQVEEIRFRKQIQERKKRGKEKTWGGTEGGWEAADCRQWKSTADSSNPRSLPGMIVMESLRQNLKRKPLQQQALLLCQLLKRLLYTMHLPLCVPAVDNREIWPWYISVLLHDVTHRGSNGCESLALF